MRACGSLRPLVQKVNRRISRISISNISTTSCKLCSNSGIIRRSIRGFASKSRILSMNTKNYGSSRSTRRASSSPQMPRASRISSRSSMCRRTQSSQRKMGVSTGAKEGPRIDDRASRPMAAPVTAAAIALATSTCKNRTRRTSHRQKRRSQVSQSPRTRQQRKPSPRTTR